MGVCRNKKQTGFANADLLQHDRMGLTLVFGSEGALEHRCPTHASVARIANVLAC